MKKWLLTLTLVPTLFGSTASAQNGCFSPSPCCAPSYLEGFYLGGHVGFLNYHNQHVDLGGFLAPLGLFFISEGGNFARTKTSWEAGVTLGYDWSCCNKLFGLVWDWDWTSAETRITNHVEFADVIPSDIAEFDLRRKVQWFSTLRGRAGILLCDTLFYLTAGAALADFRTHIDSRYRSLATDPFRSESHSLKNHHWGWTAGFGTEFAFWCNWSLNAEILYMRFDTKRFSFRPIVRTDLSRADFDVNDDLWIGRISLNYHFSLGNW